MFIRLKRTDEIRPTVHSTLRPGAVDFSAAASRRKQAT
jgi:hypothetical protein